MIGSQKVALSFLDGFAHTNPTGTLLAIAVKATKQRSKTVSGRERFVALAERLSHPSVGDRLVLPHMPAVPYDTLEVEKNLEKQAESFPEISESSRPRNSVALSAIQFDFARTSTYHAKSCFPADLKVARTRGPSAQGITASTSRRSNPKPIRSEKQKPLATLFNPTLPKYKTSLDKITSGLPAKSYLNSTITPSVITYGDRNSTSTVSRRVLADETRRTDIINWPHTTKNILHPAVAKSTGLTLVTSTRRNIPTVEEKLAILSAKSADQSNQLKTNRSIPPNPDRHVSSAMSQAWQKKGGTILDARMGAAEQAALSHDAKAHHKSEMLAKIQHQAVPRHALSSHGHNRGRSRNLSTNPLATSEGHLPNGPSIERSTAGYTSPAIHLSGEINIDSRQLGKLTGSSQAREASLPTHGPSRVNLRTVPLYTGVQVPR